MNTFRAIPGTCVALLLLSGALCAQIERGEGIRTSSRESSTLPRFEPVDPAERVRWVCAALAHLRSDAHRIDGAITRLLLAEARRPRFDPAAIGLVRADLTWGLAALERLDQYLIDGLSPRSDPRRAFEGGMRLWVAARAQLDRALAGLEPVVAKQGRAAAEVRDVLESLGAWCALLDEGFERGPLAPEERRDMETWRREGDVVVTCALEALRTLVATLRGASPEARRELESLSRGLGVLRTAGAEYRRGIGNRPGPRMRETFLAVKRAREAIGTERLEAIELGARGPRTHRSVAEALVAALRAELRWVLAPPRIRRADPPRRVAPPRADDRDPVPAPRRQPPAPLPGLRLSALLVAAQALDQEASRLADAAADEDLVGRLPRRIVPGFALNQPPAWTLFPARFARVAERAKALRLRIEEAERARRTAGTPGGGDPSVAFRNLESAAIALDRDLGRAGDRGLHRDVETFRARVVAFGRHSAGIALLDRDVQPRLADVARRFDALCRALRVDGFGRVPQRIPDGERR